MHSLIGLLNFAFAVVLPGRNILRRMIDLTRGKDNKIKRGYDKEAK